MDATFPFLILYICLSSLLFSMMQNMACCLTGLPAHYSGPGFFFIKFVTTAV